jgi:hypothetical protein
MFKNICLPHAFNQTDGRLKDECEKYYSFSTSTPALRKEAKINVSEAMRSFFEAVEMQSSYNFERTRELLERIRDDSTSPGNLKELLKKNGVIPNCQQMALNYMKFHGNIPYKEKWLLLKQEILKIANFRKARLVSGKKAGIYECCIQFIKDGGLEAFYSDHKEFLRTYQDESEEGKKKGIFVDDESIVVAGGGCENCPHRNEANVFLNPVLQEAL